MSPDAGLRDPGKEVSRELIASTGGNMDGASISGAVGVDAGDTLEFCSNFAAATNRGRVSVLFLPKVTGVEWWVGRLNNAFASPNKGKYTQWYHKPNNVSADTWFQQSNGDFNIKKPGLVTVDMFQVRFVPSRLITRGA